MWKRLLGLFAVALVAVIGGGLAYMHLKKPAMAPPREGKVSMAPERIARGRYLFEVVADCNGCHSQRDFTRFGGPVVASGKGQGFVFPDELGLPGSVVAPNITPDPETGIGKWTDGEKIRAIREGVDRDGRALFPMMPYEHFARMSDQEVESLVAYMNTLAPVRNPLPVTRIKFPVWFFIKSVPKPVGSVPPMDRSNPVKYGEYLTTLGDCIGCHTPPEQGQPLPGRNFAVPPTSHPTPKPEPASGARSSSSANSPSTRSMPKRGRPRSGPMPSH
ncbi:MAG: cytochrome c [Acidobacteria bacterium]|nr:cytochrome c [Acidobacteriota bacterium]